MASNDKPTIPKIPLQQAEADGHVNLGERWWMTEQEGEDKVIVELPRRPCTST
jgi:hypothetical protein